MKEKLISALKEILGENFIFLPDSSIHKNRRNVMHTDTTSWIQAGMDLYGMENDFRMVTMGIYGQDSEGGQGLRLVQGSHKIKDPFLSIRKNFFLRFLRSFLSEEIYKYFRCI